MYFLPVSLAVFLLLLVLLPILFALAPAVAFAKLGLNPLLGYAFFLLCLVGGGINIPIFREKIDSPEAVDEAAALFFRYLGVRVPVERERVIAINLGGAILPGLLCLYLLRFSPLPAVLVSTTITSAVAYIFSRPVKGVGIVMPPFIPPVVAAITAITIAGEHATQVAYISGVMGTIIGADLIRLPRLRDLQSRYLSIGGAGVFDGIFLVGIVSVLLA